MNTTQEQLLPGSDKAVEAGCKCPRVDNGYGRGYLGGSVIDQDGRTVFIVNMDCPLHGQSSEDVEE